MKKSLLIFSASLLVAGVLSPINVKEIRADGEPTVANDIAALISNYIGEGSYTKKTTIALNDEAIGEMAECFHNSLTARKRTTYYRPNQLLLAEENGAIPAGSGSYVYDNGEVKRASATELFEGGFVEGMWANVQNPVSCGQLEATRLEDYYVTLNTFTADGYFANWNLDDSSGTYYYDLGEKEMGKDEDGVIQCSMWQDFLNFCAPMLYQKSGAYLTPKSLTIKEKYDYYGVKYLTMSMYLADADREGKLLEGYEYLAQARIYKENNIFNEDLNLGVFLLGNVGGLDIKQRMTWDEQGNQYFVKGLNLAKDDLLEVWDTKNVYHNSFTHHWSNTVEKGGDYNTRYKVLMTAGSYDVYYKPDQNDIYVTAAKDTMFFKPSNSWCAADAFFKIVFKDNSGDLSTLDLSTLTPVDGYYRFTVPSGATKLCVLRMDPSGERNNVWNYTADFTLANEDANNAFEIKEDKWTGLEAGDCEWTTR